MGIKYKILLILLLLGFVTHTIITSVYYFNSQRLVKNLATYHLLSIANIQYQRMSSFIDSNFEKLNLVKSRTQLRISLSNYLTNKDAQELKLVQRIITDAIAQTSSIKDIFILDIDGKVLTASNPAKQYLDFSNKPFYLQGKQSRAVDVLLGERESDVPAIVFAAPLILTGETIGVVVMSVDTHSLNEFLRDYTGLGKTGEVIMATRSADKNILFFTPLRFESHPQLFEKSSSAAIFMDRKYRDKSDQLIMTEDYRNKPVFAVSRQMDELDIAIIVKMDQQEVRGLNDELQQLIIYLIILLVFVVLLASLFLAKKITQPVLSITEVAVMISEGDLAKRIEFFSDDELGKLAQALNKMADRLINSNLILEQKVKAKTSELQDANTQLQKIAQTDVLTGLKNRRYFDNYVNTEWVRSARAGIEVSVLLIDIDFFKSVNDSQGHNVGDEYLIKVAQTLNERISRTGDLVARYGGEEFAALLIGANKEQATTVANEICKMVEALALPNALSKVSKYVTVSIGLCATSSTSKVDYISCLKAADEQLYKAKHAGRNQVCATSIDNTIAD
ncbi:MULTISPECIES: diguanylate cyclase [Pseudoalteromonas]|uniref:diguanylate cyclase n=1 Tax=Pseudoalteromonas TaxID=53246 RepID=UPI00026CC286|nr:diguanylate cyclase [Pseudoalteromonas spongiae]ATD01192.1 hypothetical protein PSPO_b1323 [Pseudoalteromonas spongiae UST010723-006]